MNQYPLDIGRCGRSCVKTGVTVPVEFRAANSGSGFRSLQTVSCCCLSRPCCFSMVGALRRKVDELYRVAESVKLTDERVRDPVREVDLQESRFSFRGS